MDLISTFKQVRKNNDAVTSTHLITKFFAKLGITCVKTLEQHKIFSLESLHFLEGLQQSLSAVLFDS